MCSLEKGWRNAVKLNCQLLCINDKSLEAGRALLIPAAVMHKVRNCRLLEPGVACTLRKLHFPCGCARCCLERTARRDGALAGTAH